MIAATRAVSVEGFTRLEARMLAVLADGLTHTREELHACLYDTEGPLSNIKAHLTSIRKKLRPSGEDIICQILQGTPYYRRVLLVAQAGT